MRRRRSFYSSVILPLIVYLISISACCGQIFSGEVFAGSAWSVPMPLTIRQPGENTIRFKARYSTKPWRGAPYYAYRVGYEHWTLELVHHKLYLENPPPEIQHFEVSHGYNLAMVSRSIPFANDPSLFKLGLGIVITHPEGRVRGRQINPVPGFLGGGYHLSGVSFQVTVGPKLKLTEHWFIRPEAKLTSAWAKFPLLNGGYAKVPNIALHTLLGLGYQHER